MAIPEQPAFEAFLQSLSPAPANADVGTDRALAQAIPSEVLRLDSDWIKVPPLLFAYAIGSLSLDAVVRRIAAELRNRAHPAPEESALLLLAAFAHTEPEREYTAVQRFNELWSTWARADLNQHFIFDMPTSPDYRFRVGPFQVGPLDAGALEYQCSRAGSDYFERYRKMLRALRLAVRRDHFSVPVCSFYDLATRARWRTRPATHEAFTRIVDHYFATISREHFEAFFEALDEVQELPTVLGSGWFDARRLREFAGSQRVSVYLNIGPARYGFVSPSSQIMSVDLGGAHLGIPETEEYLRRHYGLDTKHAQQEPVYQMLRAFSHFVALAERHHQAGRHSEGFLHHVIALELLLGEKGSSTESVSKRSAVLTHTQRGLSLDAAVAEMEDIYDARSKYVHAGHSPAESLWACARAVCREVAFCLLRLQHLDRGKSEDFRNQWVLTIDHVASTRALDREPAPDDLAAIGVIGSGSAADLLRLLQTPRRRRVESNS